jgi:hypothetical protein
MLRGRELYKKVSEDMEIVAYFQQMSPNEDFSRTLQQYSMDNQFDSMILGALLNGMLEAYFYRKKNESDIGEVEPQGDGQPTI